MDGTLYRSKTLYCNIDLISVQSEVIIRDLLVMYTYDACINLEVYIPFCTIIVLLTSHTSIIQAGLSKYIHCSSYVLISYCARHIDQCTRSCI